MFLMRERLSFIILKFLKLETVPHSPTKKFLALRFLLFQNIKTCHFAKAQISIKYNSRQVFRGKPFGYNLSDELRALKQCGFVLCILILWGENEL